MRVIRPDALSGAPRRRPLLVALATIGIGLLAIVLMAIGPAKPAPVAVMAMTAAGGVGIGLASLVRIFRPDSARRASDALVALLAPAFDDTYALVVSPRLPVRGARRLDGLLVGPAGVRALTARDWVGRYRVRGRTWEFDARGRRGWIPCRTNPSLDATRLVEGVARWARDAGLPDISLRPAIAFPHRHSTIVLEEPADEVVTADNVPWWANTIGRVRRLDPATAARVLETVLDAADASRQRADAPAPVPRS